MKGIIFNLLEDVVTEEYGEAAWDKVLEGAGTEGAYTSLGNYPDTELVSLVQAASEATGVVPNDLIRWFGRKSLPKLAEAYPQFFQAHKDTRAFLLTLNDIIHTEVRKLYPGAETPFFRFDASSPDTLKLKYVSKRRLCALAEGFIEATAEHYEEEVTMRQSSCMLRGDEECTFELGFRARPSGQTTATEARS